MLSRLHIHLQSSQVKYAFFSLSVASTPASPIIRILFELLDQHGIKHVYFESAGMAHEWQTWRRSLHGFAPMLFGD
jgi:enterochelin esterase family protein